MTAPPGGSLWEREFALVPPIIPFAAESNTPLAPLDRLTLIVVLSGVL